MDRGGESHRQDNGDSDYTGVVGGPSAHLRAQEWNPKWDTLQAPVLSQEASGSMSVWGMEAMGVETFSLQDRARKRPWPSTYLSF